MPLPFAVTCQILLLNCIQSVSLLPISGSDHGVKAHGDGWLLTIALIEANGVAGAGTPGLPDPYVVFTCNGKKKTSSVKYQTSEPKWNG
jgi:Ca2+-dependent lipid-binding protein